MNIVINNIGNLKKFENIHLGETAFLIGNGPSVRAEDLEEMSNSLTFCFNRFHLAYGDFQFRPSYTLCCDRQMREDFGQEIVEKSAGTVFIAAENKPEFEGTYEWLYLEHLQPDQLFKESIEKKITTGGSVVVLAIQLAYYMGITKFYLYGVDHTAHFNKNENAKDAYRSAIGDGNHFIKNYRSGKPWCPQNTPQVEESFRVCSKFMNEQGGFVKNTSRFTRLEVIETIDFESVIG